MANDPVFLDTGGLLALLNKDESLHADAVACFQLFERERRTLITTNLVLAELGNSLSRSPSRTRSGEFIVDLLEDSDTNVVFVERPLFLTGISRFGKYLDKTWGLVDCISFEVMKAAGLREAFTADRHFEQAGFRCLLRGGK